MPSAGKKGKDKRKIAGSSQDIVKQTRQKRIANNRTDEASSGAQRIAGFHLLGRSLHPISQFEMKMSHVDKHDDASDLLQLVNTEDKQLQCIKDMYSIFRAQPKYKATKDPRWLEVHEPLTVLQYYLRRLGTFAAGDDWMVDTWHDGEQTRYRFIIIKYFHLQIVDGGRWLPLDFLPLLKKRDEPLHDMIVDIVALISRYNKIPLWDEDGDFSVILKDLKESPENDLLSRQREIYSTGIAAKYLKLIRKRQKSATCDALYKAAFVYAADSQRKQSLVWWIRDGLEIVKMKDSLLPYSFVPHHVNGEPITPQRLYKFIWSFHNHDVLYARSVAKQRKCREKYGKFLPVMFTATKPGERISKLHISKFPERISSFLDFGISLFSGRHKAYFYKNSLEQPRPLSETLFEQIEVANANNYVKTRIRL